MIICQGKMQETGSLGFRAETPRLHHADSLNIVFPKKWKICTLWRVFQKSQRDFQPSLIINSKNSLPQPENIPKDE